MQDSGGFRIAVIADAKVAGDGDFQDGGGCRIAVIADAKVAVDGDCRTVVW